MEMRREKKYTYTDYLTWDDGKRYELIDGEVYMMSPAPTTSHQRIQRRLTTLLDIFLDGKQCEAFPAPFDVRLNSGAADDTVVQPDITVVCDPGKIDERGCRGVPDMVVEILSPSTARRDQLVKFNTYLAAGVREYWIVSPQARIVQVNLLRDGGYVIQVYGDTDVVPVGVLSGCEIHMADVFPPAPVTEPKGPDTPAG